METRSKKANPTMFALPPISLFKYRKQLRQLKTYRQEIILISNTKMTKYQVYLDEEIGMNKFLQNQLVFTEMDEDFDSSDQIVENGIKRCESFLWQYFKPTEQQTSSQEQIPTDQEEGQNENEDMKTDDGKSLKVSRQMINQTQNESESNQNEEKSQMTTQPCTKAKLLIDL